MRFLISLLTFSLTFFLISSCSIFKQQSPSFDSLEFGKGGGFTGKYDDYKITEQGCIYKKSAAANQFELVRTLNRKELKDLTNKIDDAALYDINFNFPYNISCYIQIAKSGKVNKIVWGDSKKPPPEEISNLFEKLMSLVSQLGKVIKK